MSLRQSTCAKLALLSTAARKFSWTLLFSQHIVCVQMVGALGAQPCAMAPGPQDNELPAAAGSSATEHNPLQITRMAVDDGAAAACC